MCGRMKDGCCVAGKKAQAAWSAAEWPSNRWGFSQRPRRGPRIHAPMRAEQPPVIWTTPEPAVGGVMGREDGERGRWGMACKGRRVGGQMPRREHVG